MSTISEFKRQLESANYNLFHATTNSGVVKLTAEPEILIEKNELLYDVTVLYDSNIGSIILQPHNNRCKYTQSLF